MPEAKPFSRPMNKGKIEQLRILVVTVASASPLSIFGLIEAFTEANGLHSSDKVYSVETFFPETGSRFWPPPGDSNSMDEAGHNLPLDTLLVVGGLEVEPTPADGRLLDLIRTYSSRARRIVGVSSGTFLLAEAGLLTQKRATTHWTLAEQLTRAHRDIQFVANRLYVRDGKFYTSAGAASTIDLALALIQEDFGTSLAIAVAKRLLIFINRSDVHPQVSNVLLAQGTEMDALRNLLVWISDNLREDLSVAKLARRAAMSERNFARHFLREVGTSPGQYVSGLRVDAAMNLLSRTKYTLKEIAESAGFGTAASLRRSFQHVCKMTPAQYRLRVSEVTMEEDCQTGGTSPIRMQAPLRTDGWHAQPAGTQELHHLP